MAKNNAINLDVTPGSDGYTIAGGDTERSLQVTGANSVLGATSLTVGSVTLTYPGSSDTLVGRASADTLTNKILTIPTITNPVVNGTFSGTAFLDEDNFASDSPNAVASQQSIKAYIATQTHTQNTDTGTTSPTFAIDSDAVTPLKLKNSSGELQVRNNADDGYLDLRIRNLVVEGTSTIVQSEVVTIADNILLLNSNVTTAATENGGIEIERGTQTNATVLWDETSEVWTAGLVGSTEVIRLGLVDLEAEVTGTLPVVNGGTGQTTFTDGQLLIGKTDGTLAKTTLTEGANITITEGDGTITIASSASGGTTWNEETGTSETMAVNNAYIANNGSLVTFTLPTTAAVGSTVRVVGKGAGGWKIEQNASELIHFLGSTTTTGTSGYLQSTSQYDAVELVCTVADTAWTVISSMGNITVA